MMKLFQNKGLWVGLQLLATTLLLASCSIMKPLNISPQIAAEDYTRAERFLPGNESKYISNGTIQHHWIGNSDIFWYARDTKEGKEYVVVDAATGQKRPAFDHDKLITFLSSASGSELNAGQLNVKNYIIKGETIYVGLQLAHKMWLCDMAKENCSEMPEAVIINGEFPSPDGKWTVFTKDHNLYLRSLADGSVKALTKDGVEHYSYGKLAGSSTMPVSLRRMGMPLPPVAVWSSDSKKVITHRLDERKVKDLHLLQYAPETGSARPVLHSYRQAMPGDKDIPKSELFIFDVEAGSATKVKHPGLDVLYVSSLAFGRIWWAADNSQIYVAPTELYFKKQKLLVVDASTGMVNTLIEEKSDSYVELSVNVGSTSVRTLSDGQIIWYSERDGWGHLYRYDKSGKLINQITNGDWQVREIVRVDEQNQQITFTAGGREAGQDPYFNHLYMVNFDGSEMRQLSSGNANHEITIPARGLLAQLKPGAPGSAESSLSPSGKYFVETTSTPNTPPVTLLKSTDGKSTTIVEKADISALEQGGLVMPEPFEVLAADGKTKIFGNIFRPSNFDPDKSYPVIDSIYPGPQASRSAKSFKPALFGHYGTQSLAELGFIVVSIDGRGTPGRSKIFHDVSYGDLGQAGNLEDHMAGFKQLAERYPYMDLNRVGIYGHSGGGYASTRAMLSYPDFYKVAVSSSGNHVLRGYSLAWGTYQGPFSNEKYESTINARLAANLKGKLLLVHGDMDDNVHPAHTIQIINALIQANKDFDMLLLPNQAHGFRGPANRYFTRKRWDYFIEHLLGVDPVKNYQVNGAN